MSSSSEVVPAVAVPRVAVPRATGVELRPLPRPELGGGAWTRHGSGSVVGDPVTEAALGALADQARQAARAQGYAVGWAEGRRDAFAEADRRADETTRRRAAEDATRAEEHAAALEALAAAARHLADAVTDARTAVVEQATGLALALVEELLGHELSVRADPGADVVRRVLAAVPADPTARVRLHPGVVDHPAVQALAARGVEVRADPALAAADAVVETDTTLTDLRIDAALDRLREVLR